MFAYCLYLLGAGWALWQPERGIAITIVAVALVFDIGATVAPLFGVSALTFAVSGGNIALLLSPPLGLLIWLLVGGALVARWRGRAAVFRGLLLAGLLIWFLCFQALQIGLHVLPRT